MIDQPTIDRILDAANIVDVVSEFVTLRKRGVNLVGLCPFHTDKTPSFYVSPAKNICKCFACGEGGTAVHFIMKHEQLSYYDALRFLAKKYNIEIQEKELTEAEKQVRSDRESMFIVNAFAQQYFTTQLHEHIDGQHIGMRYFIERGFREDIIKKFQLGYSLDKRDAFFQAAVKSGYKKEYLEKTGLAVMRDDGSIYDRFRGRVIFPVHTVSGKVVAFGGRVLKKDDKTAKYVNSPESEIYHKSNELYGIYFAKQAIVKADKCFLVEGYTDVISMHQAGIENVVASSGTALTQGQIRLIHRFSNNITVLYDGDAAGIKAALRGIDLLLEEGLNIKVVLLPDGEDPDSFARKQNAASFNDFIQTNETDFIRFKTKLLLEDAGNDPIKRSALISDIVRTIAIIPDNIARSVYVRECSGMLEIDERVILSEINKIRAKNQEKTAVPSGNRNTYPSTGEITGTVPPAPAPDYSGMPDYPGIPENGYSEAPAGYPPEEVFSEESVPYVPVQRQPAQSPYEKYEKELLRYVIRYGERILYNYFDEEQQKQVTMRVAEYIRFDLERDELTFYTPLYKEILDEAIRQISSAENFTAQRYFLSHPNPAVSKLAANLISEKYQLSKYHSKFQALEKEEDKLDQLVPREIFEMKNAYISQQIKEIRQLIKNAGDDMEKITELMTAQTRLNEIKGVLSKELGERIVLKM